MIVECPYCQQQYQIEGFLVEPHLQCVICQECFVPPETWGSFQQCFNPSLIKMENYCWRIPEAESGNGEYRIVLGLDHETADEKLFLLLKNKTPIWGMKWYSDAYFCIINDGVTILTDHQGIFIFSSYGKMIWQKHGRDLIPPDIVENNRFVVCYGEMDTIIVIDLNFANSDMTIKNPKIRYHHLPRLDDIFLTDIGVLVLKYGKYYVNVSSEGELINHAELTNAQNEMLLTSHDNYALWNAATEIMINQRYENLDDTEKAWLTKLLMETLKRDVSQGTKAATMRNLGDFAYADGQWNTALEWYEEALALNPKLPIKRKIATLKK